MILKFKHLFSSKGEQNEIVHPNPNSDVEDGDGQDNSSPARAPRDDNSLSGDAGASVPPSASAPTWMSIAMNTMNNNMAGLAVVAALAIALTGAIALNTRTGAVEVKISKASATGCIERRLHDAKPRAVAGRKLQTCTTTIDPPDVTSNLNNCVYSASPGNDNVLQQAINDAKPGDVICMNPGKYYTACQTHIDKALTILGACSGVPFVGADSANFDPTTGPRPSCDATGETVWVASDTKGDSNGGLQGIFVDTENVIIDGISFYEESKTFRRTVGVLCDAAPGTYQNIKVLNNYMKGQKISASCGIGGLDASKFPKTLIDLEYSGNFIKAYEVNNFEPLGFRGQGYAAAGVATPTLTNLKIVNNVIGCKGDCQVLNLHRSIVNGDSSISNNDFYENTNQVCPITTDSNFFSSDTGYIPGGRDNINAGDCPTYPPLSKSGKNGKCSPTRP